MIHTSFFRNSADGSVRMEMQGHAKIGRAHV